ncbi:Gramicidin S synthase 2 [Grimontia celer]|uniref:Gramicidin S synthase 2 n=1 Tax=Grimontia celer TaxID=1796497 RepID=A0A128EST6_9GAMM|nr:AMP-binding protein [Grimontia celer]CZF77613.1 Gramicidin S synthase 2 [Grimontia celer]
MQQNSKVTREMKLRTLTTSIRSWAEQRPNDTAVVADDKNWTYQDLVLLANDYKSEFENLHLAEHSPVAVTAKKTVDTLALMIALGELGHTPLVVSPDLGSAVKPEVFLSAGVVYELSADRTTGRANISVSTIQNEKIDADLNTKISKDSPLMLTTSGTTGIPKVVCLSEMGISAFFSWAKSFFHLGHGSKVLSYAPLNFDLSLFDVWATLSAGGAVIFVDPAKATSSDYLISLVQRTQPNVIQGVPLLYSLLCEGNDRLGGGEHDVDHILVTGDVTPKLLRKRMAEMYPDSQFHNVYGCTETNDSFVHTSMANEFSDVESLPLGNPIEGSVHRIVDKDGEITMHGVGELHTSTPFLAQGYTSNQKTLSTFYWDDVEKRRYYRTGDMVSIGTDGVMTLQGRSDHIVKVRGVRTNLRDIECTLAQSNLVEESIVFPVNDEVEGVILHAVVKTNEGQEPNGFTLRLHCSENLPLTSVPRRFHFLNNPLPRTSTGKPDRQAIMNSIEL